MSKQQSQILKRALKAKGWNERGTELAKATGIHITLIRRYIDGQVKIGTKNAFPIARELELTIEQVLCGSAS